MKVFVDLHHFDLYYSLQLLFEKRLGWKLYRPIGYDWRDQGYWSLHYIPLIQEGYLSTENNKEIHNYFEFSNPEWSRHGLEVLKIGQTEKVTDGFYRIYDKSKDIWQNGITLEAFKRTKFDIIISSVPWHWDGFERLRKKYQPQAKHIFQAGNAWDPPPDCKNMMFSTPPIHLPDINYVQYHQEFDTNVFSFGSTTLPEKKSIYAYNYSIVSAHVMNEVTHFLPEYEFKFLGRDLGPVENILIRTDELARSIQSASFLWHIKPDGDGYGHLLHNYFACGKPVITSIAHYMGKCGFPLFTDRKTCIDVTNLFPQDIANRIRLFSQQDKYSVMCHNVYKRFKEIVDFNQEFQEIKRFLDNLQ